MEHSLISGPPPHSPVWNGKDELPSCKYDCRKTCENINMLDLLFERYAKEHNLDKGTQVRSCYWMLNDLWEAGMTIEDIRYAVQTGVSLADAKSTRLNNHGGGQPDIGAVIGDLQRMLDDLRGVYGQK